MQHVDLSKNPNAAMKEIGRLVRVRRNALGISQIALAQRASWSRSRLIDLENGKPLKGVSFGKLASLLDSLGMQLAVTPKASGHHIFRFSPDQVKSHKQNAIRINGPTKLHLPSIK